MVLKRAFADRVVLAAAFFVVLFGATLVAAIPIYVNAVGQSGLRERLERAPVTEANLEATAPVSGGEEAALDSQVTKLTQAALAPVGGAPVYRSGESEPFNAAGGVVVFGFFDGIQRPREPRRRALAARRRGRRPGAGRCGAPPPRRRHGRRAEPACRRAPRVGARRGDLPGRPPVVGVLVGGAARDDRRGRRRARAARHDEALVPLARPPGRRAALAARAELPRADDRAGRGSAPRAPTAARPAQPGAQLRRAGLGRDGAARASSPPRPTRSTPRAQACSSPRSRSRCSRCTGCSSRPPCCSSGAWSRPRASACAARAPVRSCGWPSSRRR